MPRHFLEIAFKGTAYRGWQVQPDAPSVQATLEAAMRRILQLPRLHVVGCGRTDTGVHASKYFLHFEVPEEGMATGRLVHQLNSLLPEDIAVRRIIDVADNAHARFSAVERGYIYRITRIKDPFAQDLAHRLHPPLDIEAMNLGAKDLLGTQDFSSFSRVGSDNRTSICDVRRAEWEASDDGYRFTIHADRFLRNMVRAIVGTLLRVGKGQMPPGHIGEVLAARDRSAAGRSAPACGLYLYLVRYPFIPDTMTEAP